jgi:hypothetical protein
MDKIYPKLLDLKEFFLGNIAFSWLGISGLCNKTPSYDTKIFPTINLFNMWWSFIADLIYYICIFYHLCVVSFHSCLIGWSALTELRLDLVTTLLYLSIYHHHPLQYRSHHDAPYPTRSSLTYSKYICFLAFNVRKRSVAETNGNSSTCFSFHIVPSRILRA